MKVIVGIGIDSESRLRIEAACAREPVFRQKLQDQSGNFDVSNFTIFEAFFKAIGCPTSLDWNEVMIFRESGRPSIKLKGKLARIWSNTEIHVSITHAQDIVTAIVMIERP